MHTVGLHKYTSQKMKEINSLWHAVPNFSIFKPASWVERRHNLQTWESFRTATGRSMYPTNLSNQYWLGYAPSRFPKRNGYNTKSSLQPGVFIDIKRHHGLKPYRNRKQNARFCTLRVIRCFNLSKSTFLNGLFCQTKTTGWCLQTRYVIASIMGKNSFPPPYTLMTSFCLTLASVPFRQHSAAERRSRF